MYELRIVCAVSVDVSELSTVSTPTVTRTRDEQFRSMFTCCIKYKSLPFTDCVNFVTQRITNELIDCLIDVTYDLLIFTEETEIMPISYIHIVSV